jgi:uncharacterized membrane-anchored protein YitT (DUF2179 family)
LVVSGGHIFTIHGFAATPDSNPFNTNFNDTSCPSINNFPLMLEPRRELTEPDKLPFFVLLLVLLVIRSGCPRISLRASLGGLTSELRLSLVWMMGGSSGGTDSPGV